MTKFKSKIVPELLNAGQADIDSVKREEAKIVLNLIGESVVKDSRSWISLVVGAYLGEGNCWEESDITNRLLQIKHDINLLRNKLVVKESLEENKAVDNESVEIKSINNK